MEKILYRIFMLLLQISVIIGGVPLLYENKHFFLMTGLLITGVCCCIFDIIDLIIAIEKYKIKNILKGKENEKED